MSARSFWNQLNVGGHRRMKDVLVSWSGGKDSCVALDEIRKASQYRVAALLTTITRDYDRISMHGVRRELLVQQAAALGLPLHLIPISLNATNEEYETALVQAVSQYRAKGVDSIVFGDLFLEDIKTYRDQFLARHNLRGIYPIWKRGTAAFVRDFIAAGHKAVITCVNSAVLDRAFAGAMLDETFLNALPPGIDPAGENGEFHTFVFDGPGFSEPVRFSLGETVMRDSFWFCDLLSTEAAC
jgi:uncharacterized protein (TIGR00290 family)